MRRLICMSITIILTICVNAAFIQAAAFRGDEIHEGDLIELGQYPQNKKEEDPGSPVSWLVLKIEGREALLLSEYCLDNIPYNMDDQDTSWKDCSLRQWLNSAFLEKTFTGDDRDRLIEKTQENEPNSVFDTPAGKSTKDYVFVLSEQEVGDNLKSRSDRRGRVTKWAEEQGAYKHEEFETAFWWLRTPGKEKNEAMCVGAEGSVMMSGYMTLESDVAVRPAIWIRLD